MWFRDTLNFKSRMHFYLWRLSKNSFSVRLKLKSGPSLLLRSKPYNDMLTAHEIFAAKIYEFPARYKLVSPSVIVDLGANVGFSCVYWLNEYPNAKIMAFEPHPLHASLIQQHIAMNFGMDRVFVFEMAAGTKTEKMYLTDDQYCSTLTSRNVQGSILVEVCDWIEQVKNQRIDLLKIDIEGGEYSLLSDTRFGELEITLCVIEWHNTKEFPNGREWCLQKLSNLGYQVSLGKFDGTDNGLLWAFRN